MSQSVNKLKELLFDAESQALVDLEHRIERVAKADQENHTSVSQRLDAVFERTGTEERFRSSVATVLDGALREAEIAKHAALSDAVAPLVVRTIKTEIANSQDELVEALYPMTGRMVQAYVASAIKDLTNQINRTFERNPVMLRLNSLITGRSIAELALADAQELEVDELYLIKRGSGELIARWPDNHASSNRDSVMGGILTAINDFATEAFQSDGTALRQIDLGDNQVYLRASPTYLLAAKCTGTANTSIEQQIDAEFLSAIEQHRELARSVTTGPEQTSETQKAIVSPLVLSDLANSLKAKINTYYDENAPTKSGANPAKFLFGLIGLTIAAWLAWSLIDAFLTNKTQTKAAYAISTTEEMDGYPVTIDTASYGRAITVTGLAPSMGVKHNVIETLYALLPSTRINDNLAVVNNNAPDLTPELTGLNNKIGTLSSNVSRLDTGLTRLARNVTSVESNVSGNRDELVSLDQRLRTQTVDRALTHTLERLRSSVPVVQQLLNTLDEGVAKNRTSQAKLILEGVLTDLDSRAGQLDLTPTGKNQTRTTLSEISFRVNEAAQLISPVLQPEFGNDVFEARTTPKVGTDLSQTAEILALAAEHFATLATATSQAALMKPPPAFAPTPREKLEAWTRANAIFFSTGTDFNNPRAARAKLKQLATLAKDARALVRVVGFTDEKGALAKNSTLSLERANKIRRFLVSEGIRSNMLTSVGRNNARDISTKVGEASPNRRVEFEVGFIGERSQ